MNNELKRYNVWKSNSNSDPIDGTDRTLTGPSKRWIMRQITYENNIKYNNELIVRLPNGCFYNCSQF